LVFVNITGNWKNRLAHTRQIIIADWLTRYYHKESSSPHPAIVPIEGAVLFELDLTMYWFPVCHFRCMKFKPLVIWIWNQNTAISTIVGTSLILAWFSIRLPLFSYIYIKKDNFFFWRQICYLFNQNKIEKINTCV
jgi:hypothetical protein